MRKYLMIAAGGFLGAVLRFYIRSIQPSVQGYGFPVNTLIINIAGSFILGLIISAAAEFFGFGEDEKLGMITGFIGAFTTFSSLSKEVDMLVWAHSIPMAAVYVSLSVLLGLGAVYIGVKSGEKLVLMQSRKE